MALFSKIFFRCAPKKCTLQWKMQTQNITNVALFFCTKFDSISSKYESNAGHTFRKYVNQLILAATWPKRLRKEKNRLR